MNTVIRKMQAEDKPAVFDMMRVFYASDAVSTNGSAEIFENDINECISDSPFLNGYVFETDGEISGYAMTAHSYSTEFGKPCVWIEDLYVKEKLRKKGAGTKFFAYIEGEYPDSLLRLEVEEFNTGALSLYKKRGFSTLPYMEMYKLK